MAATQKSKQPAAKNDKQKANQQKEKIIGLIALIVVAFAGGAKVFGCAPAVDSNASATVSFLDVGQGDSVLIQAAGKTVLIDGGERDQGSVVLDDLKKYGVTTIDYMIASHPHSDHIGGLVDVLEDAAVSVFHSVCAASAFPDTLLSVFPAVPQAASPMIMAVASRRLNSFFFIAFLLICLMYARNSSLSQDSKVHFFYFHPQHARLISVPFYQNDFSKTDRRSQAT